MFLTSKKLFTCLETKMMMNEEQQRMRRTATNTINNFSRPLLPFHTLVYLTLQLRLGLMKMVRASSPSTSHVGDTALVTSPVSDASRFTCLLYCAIIRPALLVSAFMFLNCQSSTLMNQTNKTTAVCCLSLACNIKPPSIILFSLIQFVGTHTLFS